ncbi:PREDICTED: uncharacterized protein LOC104734653 isoform X3 [Camelina sativa]|uniref:Uncharacterized protein LOC104734653 isoform X3 n=1 Tax=Camelina sativa TaxID=90675 RepID=A0ABM1R0R4_CAMSA|nr:PREDICTED: uncharacterized protein LOC104734653 isoform X3 [Camelina sativa]
MYLPSYWVYFLLRPSLLEDSLPVTLIFGVKKKLKNPIFSPLSGETLPRKELSNGISNDTWHVLVSCRFNLKKKKNCHFLFFLLLSSLSTESLKLIVIHFSRIQFSSSRLMLKAKALCYRLVKSRKATSCALPSEPSPSTSVAAVSAVSGDHRSRCLSLIVKLGGRGLANSAREVISRVIDGSSSISEAALVVDFAGNNGIELDSCCCGALIRKLTEMGQPGLAETFYNERVIGNEEELLKLLLVLTGGSCEYWYSRRWPRDYGLYETRLSKRKQRRCHCGYLSVLCYSSSVKP